MSTAAQTRHMTRDEFFDWAQAQDHPYEFDGFQPVAMTRSSINHSRMIGNLHAALRSRLRGGGCEPMGPEAGIATVGDAVRYPDAVVSCTKTPGTAYLVLNPVVVFEVLSPTSGRTDRIDKLREYRAVPSIRRYVILEQTSAALVVFVRAEGVTDWTATALTADDTLAMPEIGIEIPLAEFYEDVDFPDAELRGA